MLHRSCNDGIIANNVVYNNAHAGVAVFETINTHVYGNTLTGNKCEFFTNRADHEMILHLCRMVVSGWDIFSRNCAVRVQPRKHALDTSVYPGIHPATRPIKGHANSVDQTLSDAPELLESGSGV